MTLFAQALSTFQPQQRIRSLAWFVEHVQTHEGRHYDGNAYPHLGAPGGPCDAFDDDSIKTIVMQFASRLGKTFFGQAACLFSAATSPGPMLFASSVEKLAVEVINRTWAMAENCRPLREKLPPEHRRRQDLVLFSDCRLHVAWSRSTSTLADKDARVGHAGEIDKWEHLSTSGEADPLKLFTDRFKNFASHKKILESTPAVKGKSRVERARLSSTNCTFYVPCPHCKEYQKLDFKNLQWEHLANGRSDKDLARKTAYYQCPLCEKAILDEHRGPMMRAGVWCPEGCTVKDRAAKTAAREWRDTDKNVEPRFTGWDRAKWVEGKPARDGVEAGYQLSSLYALALTWGDMAAEFVESKERPQLLRNYINQWLAETWEYAKKSQTWEDLGERLIVERPRDVAPEWASLLTLAIDRQLDHFVYCLDAWGPGRTSATLRYGDAETLEEISRELMQRTFPREGGGELRVGMTFCDSGFRPTGVYEWCRSELQSKRRALPCKGSSISLDADYKVSVLGKNTSMPGMKIVHIDTIRTQGWLENVLSSLAAGDPGSAELHAGSLHEHQDFLEQLLNDAAIVDLDSSNNAREKWERIDENIPNDFRDCKRYGYAAMLLATRGADLRPPTEESRQTQSAVVSPGVSRPDGRPFI